jgi:hypothetical protein
MSASEPVSQATESETPNLPLGHESAAEEGSNLPPAPESESQSVSPAPPEPGTDPDFRSEIPATWTSIDENPELYLRLIINPFLACSAAVAWLAIVLDAVHQGWAGPLTPMMLIVLGGALMLLPRLTHMHCLDCGATARYGDWRLHLCPHAASRRIGDRPRSWRGPRPSTQFWLGLLTAWSLALWLFSVKS